MRDDAARVRARDASAPPSSARELRLLLGRHGLHARKQLGQHFLIDRDILSQIVSAAGLEAQDVVVEVGPGLGVLTRELARAAGRVIAVEVDPGMVQVLRDALTGVPKVEILGADILRFDHARHVGEQPYKVVANLPYYITSPTLRHFLETPPRPRTMVVLVQKEVAERITAKPGDLSLLAVSVQFYGAPALVAPVPAASFYPVPKVDSAILRIDVYDHPTAEVSPDQFFKVVAAGFSQPRKQLHNALQQGMWLPPGGAQQALSEAGIDIKRRAEMLALPEWVTLCLTLRRLGYLK